MWKAPSNIIIATEIPTISANAVPKEVEVNRPKPSEPNNTPKIKRKTTLGIWNLDDNICAATPAIIIIETKVIRFTSLIIFGVIYYHLVGSVKKYYFC
jgi:hypothetical protein